MYNLPRNCSRVLESWIERVRSDFAIEKDWLVQEEDIELIDGTNEHDGISSISFERSNGKLM